MMMYTKNLISRLENIVLASDAASKYIDSNFQAEVQRSLNDALPYCIKCHLKQKRDDGEPYWYHPLRVAAYAEVYIAGVNETEVRNICLLHDVLEDCDNVNEYDIEERFGDFVAQHVVELTNVFTKENYPDLSKKERKNREIDRLSKCNNLTKQIKLIDRLDGVTTYKVATNTNYLNESEKLCLTLIDSNPELGQQLLNKIKRFK